MSKPLVILSTLIAAGILAVAGGFYIDTDSGLTPVSFDQGKTMSRLFVPPTSDKEASIYRYPSADGSAFDQVAMRDGTSKHIVYDQKMTLRQVFAYFRGANGEQPGPLMYEKNHDADGHLFRERHLRLDGSLEMDGLLTSQGVYVRHLYYPNNTGDPAHASVMSERTFDKLWKPLSQIDYRPDSTVQMAHFWQDDGTEVVSNFAADGFTLLFQEKIKDGTYQRDDYLADGVTVALSTTNSTAGTIYQLYDNRSGHVAGLTIDFDNSENDVITLRDALGKPLIQQVWTEDYSAKPESGQYPRVIDHIDHYGADGQPDVQYTFLQGGPLTSVTVLHGGSTYWGARQVYAVDADGWATKVTTYDDKNTDDGGKVLTRAQGVNFVLPGWMVTRPSYQLPKLKDGLRLYGLRPQMGPH